MGFLVKALSIQDLILIFINTISLFFLAPYVLTLVNKYGFLKYFILDFILSLFSNKILNNLNYMLNMEHGLNYKFIQPGYFNFTYFKSTVSFLNTKNNKTLILISTCIIFTLLCLF
jgi:hypothetical protein